MPPGINMDKKEMDIMMEAMAIIGYFIDGDIRIEDEKEAMNTAWNLLNDLLKNEVLE